MIKLVCPITNHMSILRISTAQLFAGPDRDAEITCPEPMYAQASTMPAARLRFWTTSFGRLILETTIRSVMMRVISMSATPIACQAKIRATLSQPSDLLSPC